jgi:DNA-binding NarL/FixJ family response regulator
LCARGGRSAVDIIDAARVAGMKRILLVEDHALFRGCLAFLLERSTGHKCIQAGSFTEAHRVLDDLEGKVALAIVDLDLAGGVELVERLRKLRFGVPVLVLSADRSLERRARALEAGADDALSAETSVDDLVGAITKLISGQ